MGRFVHRFERLAEEIRPDLRIDDSGIHKRRERIDFEHFGECSVDAQPPWKRQDRL
jgi:hypothetical protein